MSEIEKIRLTEITKTNNNGKKFTIGKIWIRKTDEFGQEFWEFNGGFQIKGHFSKTSTIINKINEENNQ